MDAVVGIRSIETVVDSIRRSNHHKPIALTEIPHILPRIYWVINRKIHLPLRTRDFAITIITSSRINQSNPMPIGRPLPAKSRRQKCKNNLAVELPGIEKNLRCPTLFSRRGDLEPNPQRNGDWTRTSASSRNRSLASGVMLTSAWRPMRRSLQKFAVQCHSTDR